MLRILSTFGPSGQRGKNGLSPEPFGSGEVVRAWGPSASTLTGRGWVESRVIQPWPFGQGCLGLGPFGLDPDGSRLG